MSLNSQNSPKVSILLPTHNRADVLPFAIRSVLAQTFQDYEILIVGDGCTDNTAEIVQSFSDARICWFDLPKAPNFGYANRNLALQKARGDYIAFMAHDDLWLSDHLEKLLPLFSDEKIDIVYSRPLWVIPIGMIVPGMFNLNHRPTLMAFLNREATAIPASCVIHRRNCLTKYGFWNAKLEISGDWDMWARIIKGGGGNNFAYFADSTCLHFKANWQNESYDARFGFHFWKRLFASNQMPAALKFEVKNDATEQETVWELISSSSQQWNSRIRSAIQQVIDVCALKGNILTEALLGFNEELLNEQLPFHVPRNIDLSSLLEPFDQMLVNQKSLADIKSTLTWKIHEYVTSIYLVRKFYLVFVKPIRHLLFKFKSK